VSQDKVKIKFSYEADGRLILITKLGDDGPVQLPTHSINSDIKVFVGPGTSSKTFDTDEQDIIYFRVENPGSNPIYFNFEASSADSSEEPS
jgi:hypothetical protein